MRDTYRQTVQDEHVIVEENNTAWRNIAGEDEICAAIGDYERRGRLEQYTAEHGKDGNRPIWRVTTLHLAAPAEVAHYCDRHLPDQLRPASRERPPVRRGTGR